MENGLNVSKGLEEHGRAKLTNEQALFIRKSKEKIQFWLKGLKFRY